MVTVGTQRVSRRGPRYAGLRMSADAYLALPDDGFKYELINGVVLMSPSASFPHQRIARRILQQIANHVDARGLGEVVGETDVRFGEGEVYRPDIVFYTTERAAQLGNRLETPPDLIVEILSPATEAMDLHTKRDDYERHGVKEYWAIPLQGPAWKFTLRNGKFVEERVDGQRIASEVIAGFVLDLAAARAGVGEE